MQKLLISSLAALAMLSFCPDAQAQGFLRGIADKAVDHVKDKVENKALRGVDNAVDNALEGSRKNKKTTTESEAQSQEDTPQGPVWVCAECGKKGNRGNTCDDCGADKPSGGNEAAAQAPAKPAIEQAYAKSDFIPGDEVFFDDPMEGEQMGEFPSRWDLIEGEAEVARINGKNCISMRAESSTTIEPLMTQQEAYLPEMFTVEFDFYRGQTESSMGYIVQLRNAEYSDAVSATFSGQNSDEMTMYISYHTPTGDFRHSESRFTIEGDSWNHFALSFNKRALKVYVNGKRVANIPNCVQTNRMFLMQYSWGGFDDSGKNAVTNVRLCKGAVPLYDRLATDGKIITYAITFETGKADLKPESMVEIARITQLMQNDGSLKFEVQGHCDNTGSDKVNDPLSQKRAEAIVAALVKNGIDASRLTAKGMGSHTPLADNNSEEGRARNRRVEFVKK